MGVSRPFSYPEYPQLLISYYSFCLTECFHVCNHWILFMTREDIAEGTYLRLITDWSGSPAGLIAVVHRVGVTWTGGWSCQLRYLDRPVGVRTKAVSSESVSLRETDLVHFELVGTWIPVDVLQASTQHLGKPRSRRRSPAWRRRRSSLHQLCLFDNC